MLAVSVAVFCLVGLALIGMGYKYGTATPPMDYHGEILSGAAVSDETVMVLGAVYKVMGGTFVALGVGTVIIALTGIWNDLFWAKLAVVVMLGTCGSVAAMVPRAVEAQTGVRTPWRIAAGLSGLGLFAFVLSMI